jgi:hypothetical protein
LGLALFAVLRCASIDRSDSPNIIYILADDLGYGELGCYGQELIETPNIDKLAESGMRFTQHYSGAPVCAPARCVLLTGMHSGHAYIRGNDEWAERGDVWDLQKPLKTQIWKAKDPCRIAFQQLATYCNKQVIKQRSLASGAWWSNDRWNSEQSWL